jgi:hypothetical protein
MILYNLFRISVITLASTAVMISPNMAGEVDVVNVVGQQTSAQTYRFDVTLRHADEGWDHYANKWDVVDPSGRVLGERILHHPHVNEQPFTRSLSSIKIPDDIDFVMIRGHDSVHLYVGVEYKVVLSALR